MRRFVVVIALSGLACKEDGESASTDLASSSAADETASSGLGTSAGDTSAGDTSAVDSTGAAEPCTESPDAVADCVDADRYIVFIPHQVDEYELPDNRIPAEQTQE